jgi:hypothetical protein
MYSAPPPPGLSALPYAPRSACRYRGTGVTEWSDADVTLVVAADVPAHRAARRIWPQNSSGPPAAAGRDQAHVEPGATPHCERRYLFGRRGRWTEDACVHWIRRFHRIFTAGATGRGHSSNRGLHHVTCRRSARRCVDREQLLTCAPLFAFERRNCKVPSHHARLSELQTGGGCSTMCKRRTLFSTTVSA